MPNELFTTSYLSSYVGLVAVTYLLVQFFKEPMKKYFNDWWIRMLAVLISFIIQSFTLYVIGNFTVETVGLAILNSFLIAITAAGAHNISQSTTSVANPTTIINKYYDQNITGPQVPDVSPPVSTVEYTGDSQEDLKNMVLSQK